MWALCRRDHGLTWPEFEALTLAQLEALEERRVIEIRHARFNTGLLASIIYNANRSAESEPLEVWDFVPGFARDPEEIEADKLRQSVRNGVLVAFTRMGKRTVSQVRAEAAAMIERMKAAGTEDAEQIVREVFEEVLKVSYAE